MKNPVVVAALIFAVAALACVLIVMAPVYKCMAVDGAPTFICLHGRP